MGYIICHGILSAREWIPYLSLQWHHNWHDSVSNHQPHDCLLNRLFRRRSKKISKLRVTGFCAGNSPETGEFTAQRASNAENVSIWWLHHMNMAYCNMTDLCLAHGIVLVDVITNSVRYATSISCGIHRRFYEWTGELIQSFHDYVSCGYLCEIHKQWS